MALLGTWGANNLIIDQGKSQHCTQTLQKGDIDGDGSQDYYWEFHRYCTLRFRYVGMDYSTAMACADAVIERYSRKYMVSEPSSSAQAVAGFEDVYAGSKLMADVAVQYNGGCSYSVVVSVNEDDSKCRMAWSGTYEPNMLFVEISDPTSEYYRTYDDWTNPTPEPDPFEYEENE